VGGRTSRVSGTLPGEPIIYGSAGASPSQEAATYKPLLNVMSDLYSPTSRTPAHLRED
jgi:hypothetical protein